MIGLFFPDPSFAASTGSREGLRAEDGHSEHGLAQGVHVQKVENVLSFCFVDFCLCSLVATMWCLDFDKIQ